MRMGASMKANLDIEGRWFVWVHVCINSACVIVAAVVLCCEFVAFIMHA